MAAVARGAAKAAANVAGGVEVQAMPEMFRRIKRHKTLTVTLSRVKGLGATTARKITDHMGLHPNYPLARVSRDELEMLEEFIMKNFAVFEEVDKIRDANVDRLIEIGCYRGQRHLMGLPVRGQRTASNAKNTRMNRFRRSIKDFNQKNYGQKTL